MMMSNKRLALLTSSLGSIYLAAYFFILLEEMALSSFHPLDLISGLLFAFTPPVHFTAILLGLPNYLLASLNSLILEHFQILSRWTAMFAGMIQGVGFLTALSLLTVATENARALWEAPLIGMLAGAISGWIYWRIAIGRTHGNGRAIDAA